MGSGGGSQKSRNKQEGWTDTSGSSQSTGSNTSDTTSIDSSTGMQSGSVQDISSGTQLSTDLLRQDAQFGNLLGAADAQLAGGGFVDPLYAGGMETRAGWSPEQAQMYERIVGQGGALQGAMTGLEQTLGPYDPNNPNISAAIDAAAGDISRNFERNVMQGIDQSATAAGVGQFSGSRAGIAEGLARSDMNQQVADVATNMRLNDYQNWQNNQQNALMNAGQITAGLQGMAGAEQMERQGELDDFFNKWQYESGAGLGNLEAYKNLISGNMGGSTIGETTHSGQQLSDSTTSQDSTSLSSQVGTSDQFSEHESYAEHFMDDYQKGKSGGK